MGSQAPIPSKSKLYCQYWFIGGCFDPYCPFLHPPLIPPACSIPKSTIPCRFFQRGNCDRGANCSFMHAPPLASPKLPQLNSSLTSTSNNEDSTQACKDKNDSPFSDSSDMSSDSDVSFDVIVGENQSASYFRGSADWSGRLHHLLCRILAGCKIQERYITSENSLHRSSQSGMKRPLEQEVESKIRQIDERPKRKLRRLDNNSSAATYAEMPTNDDDDRQNGCTTYEGVLSSRFRGRIRLPKRNTSSATCHNDERRGSLDSCATQHMEPIHGRSNRERERGFGKRNGMNASHFYHSKSSTELKRAKTGMQMKACSDFEGPKPLSELLKKKTEAQAGGGK